MSTSAGISITEKAREALVRFKTEQETEEKQEGLNLRIAVIPGGCSGFSYQMNFDRQSLDGDQVIELNGLKVVVDPRSATLLSGTTVDYHDGLDGSGFTFENPNAQSSCGCGKSFS